MARAFGRSCLERTGPLLGHVDTRSAARDMEALRRALGEGKLNFPGTIEVRSSRDRTTLRLAFANG
jgi:hypothetical protein